MMAYLNNISSMDNLTIEIWQNNDTEIVNHTKPYCNDFKPAFEFYYYTVACTPLVIVGFLGNAVAVATMAQDKTSPTATFLLQSLSISDNVFLLLWFLQYSLRFTVRHFFGKMPEWYVFLRLGTFPLMYMAQMQTIGMTVVIAFNRFMAVCQPHRAPSLCTLTNMHRIVAVVTSFSILYNIPRFFDRKITRDSNGAIMVNRTVLSQNQVYETLYIDTMYYLLTFVLPVVTLLIVNSCTIKAYRESQRRKRRMTSTAARRRQANDNNITLVMINVVAVFIICQAPARLVQIIWSYKFTDCHEVQYFLIHISNMLEIVNSSANFFIYVAVRKQFRKIMMKSCICKPIRGLIRTDSPTTQAQQTTEGMALSEYQRNTSNQKKTSIKIPADGGLIKTQAECHNGVAAGSIHNAVVQKEDIMELGLVECVVVNVEPIKGENEVEENQKLLHEDSL